MPAMLPQAKLTIPGPSSPRLLGSTLSTWRFVTDSVGYARQLFQTYGPVVSLAAGGGTNIYSSLPNCPGTILVYGSGLVQQVATQHDIYHKHPLSGTMYRQRQDAGRTETLKHFGAGLFGVNGPQHRQQRQLLMPAFHMQQIASYRDHMVAITRSVLDSLKVGDQRDIADVMRLLTLRVVTKTLLGEDVGQDNGNPGNLLQEVLALLGSPQASILPLDIPGLPYHRLLSLMAQLDTEMRAIIQCKQTTAEKGQDLLSLLIEARDEKGAGLSGDELLGHTGVIFAAGHETSSNALTWTLFLLSQHPQVAADLLDELDSTLQGEAPTVEQLQRLPLLERVIKESLRILTPVPWNGRVTSQPTELGGNPLPAGTEVFVSIYHTHHLPEIYPDPETFNPDRWQSITPTPYEYNPFSAGPRTCIGAAFAMMELKIVLAMLLQRYRFQCAPRLKIDRTGSLIVMAPRQGMPMQIFNQDRQFSQGVGGVRGKIREMVNLPA